MLGISGVGGLGMSGVDLSAWVGMSGVSNVAGMTGTTAVSAPQASQVASIGMGANLPSLVQALQQFSQAEIMLALFLAFNSKRCDHHHDHDSPLDGLTAFALISAFNQRPSLPANVNFSSMVSSVSSQTAVSINVAG